LHEGIVACTKNALDKKGSRVIAYQNISINE
jgi:hypothetical protein